MLFCDVLKLNDMKFTFQCPYLQSSGNTAMLIHLCVVFGCFVQWLIWVSVTETMWFLSLKYELSVTLQNEFPDPKQSGKLDLGIEFKEAERDISDNWRKACACVAMIKLLLKPGYIF